jgi:hypothetical protein
MLPQMKGNADIHRTVLVAAGYRASASLIVQTHVEKIAHTIVTLASRLG